MTVVGNVSGSAAVQSAGDRRVRVLYSFPHRIGAARIAHTAWSQVAGVAAAGADVVVHPGSVQRAFISDDIRVKSTLSLGWLKLPYRSVGTKRACELHDLIVSRRLRSLAAEVDVVHVWPLAAKRTLKVAKEIGVPTLLERPNAHTRFAYEVVRLECESLGVPMPVDHEHAFKADWLQAEEEEYELADYLMCPSEFVAQTFRESGFPASKLLRHHYGFDETVFHPSVTAKGPDRPFTMLFAGGCAPRKGLHYALEAWRRSSAHADGLFLIAGGFIPGYRERLASLLAQPTVRVLGHRTDVADLMRSSDVFTLPSIEEGSALVTSEARGCGCVLLVSDAAGAVCADGEDGYLHKVRDVETLASQITRLHQDRSLLSTLRARSLSTTDQITWNAAGKKLLSLYKVAMRRM